MLSLGLGEAFAAGEGWILLWLLTAIAVSGLAWLKGRDVGSNLLFGLVLPPVALVRILLLGSRRGRHRQDSWVHERFMAREAKINAALAERTARKSASTIASEERKR